MCSESIQRGPLSTFEGFCRRTLATEGCLHVKLRFVVKNDANACSDRLRKAGEQ